MTDLADLQRAVEELARRVAVLEGGTPEQGAGGDAPAGEPAGGAREPFWALNTLLAAGEPGRGPDAPVGGSVVYAGAVEAPGTGEVHWQVERPLAGLLALDWEGAAPVLAALGHPVRLALVRRMVEGAHTLAELAATPGVATTGQLQHHLREMRSAGLVRVPQRGHYVLETARVVPVLTLVLAALGT